MKTIEKIFSITNKDNHKVLTLCGLKFKFKNSARAVEKLEKNLAKKIDRTAKEISLTKQNLGKLSKQIDCKIAESIKRTTPKPYLTNFTVDISHHCNLNCRGCDHFSPLAEHKFYDLSEFERDMKRLSELTGGFCDRIGIMGGEPLLNPDVLKYLEISRNCFPTAKIRLVTNGILLNKQDENFWLTLKNLNIFVEYTKYKINLDYDKLDKIIEQYGVPIDVYGYVKETVKKSYKIPLDLNGNQDVSLNFVRCFHANHCIALKNGRLYTCTVAPSIEHFNKYFNKNIPLTDKDGIDIHKAQNIEEVLEHLSKPIPFCKYCNVNGRSFGHEWGISKKEIEEWI